MIAVHALITFSEKVGFGHSITCNNFFSILKTYFFYIIFMHLESFVDFDRKQLTHRRSAALCYSEFPKCNTSIVFILFVKNIKCLRMHELLI